MTDTTVEEPTHRSVTNTATPPSPAGVAAPCDKGARPPHAEVAPTASARWRIPTDPPPV